MARRIAGVVDLEGDGADELLLANPLMAMGFQGGGLTTALRCGVPDHFFKAVAFDFDGDRVNDLVALGCLSLLGTSAHQAWLLRGIR